VFICSAVTQCAYFSVCRQSRSVGGFGGAMTTHTQTTTGGVGGGARS